MPICHKFGGRQLLKGEKGHRGTERGNSGGWGRNEKGPQVGLGSLGPGDEGGGGLRGVKKQDRSVGEYSPVFWTDQGRDTK
jgi:hypothetical protein